MHCKGLHFMVTKYQLKL